MSSATHIHYHTATILHTNSTTNSTTTRLPNNADFLAY